MKRTAAAALAVLLMLTGCGSKKKIDTRVIEPSEAETLITVTEAVTAAPRPIAERAADLRETGDTYIFDEQGVLTAEEKKQYNDYLGYLSSSRQICAGAVITDSLGGVTPAVFAQSYFTTLFGTADAGFLVLINNDTNQDYIYCAGACEQALGNTEELIAKATPSLVEGHYADALEILLPVGEQLSDRIFDRCNALTTEQMQSLRSLAETQEERRCVLFLRALPGETAAAPEPPPMPTDALPDESTALPEAAEGEAAVSEETALAEGALDTAEESPVTETESAAAAPAKASDALKAYAEEIRTNTEAEALLVIDAASGQCYIAGGDDALQTAVQDAFAAEGSFAAAQRFFSGT